MVTFSEKMRGRKCDGSHQTKTKEYQNPEPHPHGKPNSVTLSHGGNIDIITLQQSNPRRSQLILFPLLSQTIILSRGEREGDLWICYDSEAVSAGQHEIYFAFQRFAFDLKPRYIYNYMILLG